MLNRLLNTIRYKNNLPKYWKDRFNKYGFINLAVGDDGKSQELNRIILESERILFCEAIFGQRSNLIRWEKEKVLEVGVGTGGYTDVLYEYGIRDYVGVDIADVFFPILRSKYPEYKFLKHDFGTYFPFEHGFDVIVAMGVLNHVENFDTAIKNILELLRKRDGLFIGTTQLESKKDSFYCHPRSIDDYTKWFYVVSEHPFIDQKLYVLAPKNEG